MIVGRLVLALGMRGNDQGVDNAQIDLTAQRFTSSRGLHAHGPVVFYECSVNRTN
jgi:hypothetical protein